MRAALRWRLRDQFEDGVANGWQGWLRRGSADSFFSSCCCEAPILDNRHQCVTMQTLPGSSLEVIEAEFFLQLLVCLLATHRALMVAAKVRRSVLAGKLAR